MRRTFLVSMILVLVSAFAIAGAAQSQEEPQPQFVLGFQQFAGLFPELVGTPLENERHDLIGNGFQQTTGGLLVWNRLDNTVDFTNGFQTFVLTADGLLERGNDERFQFEVIREQVEEQLEARIAELIEQQPEQLEEQIETLIGQFQEQLQEQLEQLEQPEQLQPAPPQVRSVFRVTLENLTAGQPFSPPVAATHQEGVRIFQVGGIASDELADIARDGNAVPMFNLLNQTEGVTQALTIQGTEPTQSGSFEIQANPGDRFSIATMLACTNDGFTGIDSIDPFQGDTQVFLLPSWDAGREMNTERIEDLIDRCGIPVGEPLARNAEVATIPPEPIAPHPGILGVGQLDPALVGWTDPVARLTIERIGPAS